MEPFTVSLAGIPIGITPYTPEIESFFRDYLCTEPPCFTVGVTPDDLALELKHSIAYQQYKKLPPRSYSDYYLERLSLLRLIANRLPDFDAVLFHSVIIALDQSAYLFAAPSGTGKTTHINLWLQLFPRAHVLNGDKPFLKVAPDGQILACGTPWRGKEHYGVNEILPLKAICFLERAESNTIRTVSMSEALNSLLRQTHVPSGSASTMKVLHLVGKISQGVRLFRLSCNMDPEAALISSRAMLPPAGEAPA